MNIYYIYFLIRKIRRKLNEQTPKRCDKIKKLYAMLNGPMPKFSTKSKIYWLMKDVTQSQRNEWFWYFKQKNKSANCRKKSIPPSRSLIRFHFSKVFQNRKIDRQLEIVFVYFNQFLCIQRKRMFLCLFLENFNRTCAQTIVKISFIFRNVCSMNDGRRLQ